MERGSKRKAVLLASPAIDNRSSKKQKTPVRLNIYSYRILVVVVAHYICGIQFGRIDVYQIITLFSTLTPNSNPHNLHFKWLTFFSH